MSEDTCYSARHALWLRNAVGQKGGMSWLTAAFLQPLHEQHGAFTAVTKQKHPKRMRGIILHVFLIQLHFASGINILCHQQRTWELPPAPHIQTSYPDAQGMFEGKHSPFQQQQSPPCVCVFVCVSFQLPPPQSVSQSVKPAYGRCVLSPVGPDDAYLDDSHCHSISTTRLSSMKPRENTSANPVRRFKEVSQSWLSFY